MRKRYAFECRVCGCKFKCEEDEIKIEDGHETLYMHDCPCCGENVYGEPCGARGVGRDAVNAAAHALAVREAAKPRFH